MKRCVVHLVAGARPNFMKVAPLWRELSKASWCDPRLVHTGQHYDEAMSDVFLRELGLPRPHMMLEVGAGTHAEQTAGVMTAYEAAAIEDPPDCVIVVGDVNSTMAVTIAAKKLRLYVAHLEAGLRSFDRAMPEEINRLVTDALVDLLWTPSPDADENLLREGVPRERIERVGNIMIDTFEMMRGRIEEAKRANASRNEARPKCVVTLHRPSNVDDPDRLQALVSAIKRMGANLDVVFPLHPRTRARLESSGLLVELERAPGVSIESPMGYVAFMAQVTSAALVVTDSGGVQEETTYLGTPCLTLRDTTERPVTITHGTNRLVTLDDLDQRIEEILDGRFEQRGRPELWDGCTAARVVESLKRHLAAQGVFSARFEDRGETH